MQWQGDWDGRVRVKVGAPKRCANCVGREGDRGLGGDLYVSKRCAIVWAKK